MPEPAPLLDELSTHARFVRVVAAYIPRPGTTWIPSVPPSAYTLLLRAKGYAPVTRSFTVTAGEVTRLDVPLRVVR